MYGKYHYLIYLTAVSVLLTGLTVPKFDFLLGLVGSSMIMVNTFIAPSIFYLL